MAGDLKYYDFNGDGKIDGDDQYRMGNGTSPRANFGINVDMSYKGWSFNMLWQGATNYNIYVDAILMGGNSNYLPVIYDFQTDICLPTIAMHFIRVSMRQRVSTETTILSAQTFGW